MHKGNVVIDDFEMDLLVLPLLLLFLGSGISVVSKPFRLYWLSAIAFATIGSALFQVVVFFQLGFLDPFYQVAFLSLWLILFAFGTVAYLVCLGVKKCNRRDRE